MADRFTAEQNIDGTWMLFDTHNIGRPAFARQIDQQDMAERIARLLNDDWEADQPADTPEAQRAIIYKQLTTRHRIALIAILEGATAVGELGIQYPMSIVNSLRDKDLLTGSGELALTPFGRTIAQGVLRRQPKAGYSL